MNDVFKHCWRKTLFLTCVLCCSVCMNELAAQTCEGRVYLKDGGQVLYNGNDRIEMPRKKRDMLAYHDFFSHKCQRDTIALARIDSVVVWNTASPQYTRTLVPVENVGWCWMYVDHPKLQVYIYSSQGYSLNAVGGMSASQGNTMAALFMIPSKTACDFYIIRPNHAPVCLGDVYKKCEKVFIRRLCQTVGMDMSWEKQLQNSGEVNRSAMVLKVIEILDKYQ